MKDLLSFLGLVEISSVGPPKRSVHLPPGGFFLQTVNLHNFHKMAKLGNLHHPYTSRGSHWSARMTYFYLSTDIDNIDIDIEPYGKFLMGEKLLVVYSVSVDAHSNVSHYVLFCSEIDCSKMNSLTYDSCKLYGKKMSFQSFLSYFEQC